MRPFTLDLSKADGYRINEDQLIKRELKRRRLFGAAFLYTAIDGGRLPEFLSRGNYRRDDTIFAFSHRSLVWKEDGTEVDVLGDSDGDLETYISKYETPALVVWKSHQFIPEQERTEKYEYIILEGNYKFKHPENKQAAIAAIALFKGLGYLCQRRKVRDDQVHL